MSLENKPSPKRRDRTHEGGIHLNLTPELKLRVTLSANKEGIPVSFWAQRAFKEYLTAESLLKRYGFRDVSSMAKAYEAARSALGLQKGGE